GKIGSIREIQGSGLGFLLRYLVQAVQDSIEMDTAVREGLLDEGGWILLMQLEHAHKFLDPPAFRPFLSQNTEHMVVALRPIFAPAPHGSRVIKGTGSLLEQGQVVEGIKDILLMSKVSGMSSYQLLPIKDIDSEGIGFHHHLAARTVHRD